MMELTSVESDESTDLTSAGYAPWLTCPGVYGLGFRVWRFWS